MKSIISVFHNVSKEYMNILNGYLYKSCCLLARLCFTLACSCIGNWHGIGRSRSVFWHWDLLPNLNARALIGHGLKSTLTFKLVSLCRVESY